MSFRRNYSFLFRKFVLLVSRRFFFIFLLLKKFNNNFICKFLLNVCFLYSLILQIFFIVIFKRFIFFNDVTANIYSYYVERSIFFEDDFLVCVNNYFIDSEGSFFIYKKLNIFFVKVSRLCYRFLKICSFSVCSESFYLFFRKKLLFINNLLLVFKDKCFPFFNVSFFRCTFQHLFDVSYINIFIIYVFKYSSYFLIYGNYFYYYFLCLLCFFFDFLNYRFLGDPLIYDNLVCFYRKFCKKYNNVLYFFIKHYTLLNYADRHSIITLLKQARFL